MSRARALISSEALALLSAICIVAIFLVASLDRRLDTYDAQAQRLAQQVQEVMQTAAKPVQPAAGQEPVRPAPLTLQRLQGLGLQVPPELRLQVQEDNPQRWQVAVWHEYGLKRYLATPQGVTEQVR